MNPLRLDVGDDQVELWIEALPSEDQALRKIKKSDRPGEALSVAADRVCIAVRAIASRIHSELMAVQGPDELTMEFGVSIDAGARILVSAGGTFRVMLKWSKAR